MTNTEIIDCTTCKYGYEDEQLGFPMCHHPKRFSEDCVDFNMHEAKETKEPEKPMNQDGLEEEFNHYCFDFKDPDTGEAIPKNQISFSVEDALNVARHFAQWGAEHLKK